MQNKPYFFSIIIPTYNREIALDRCLKSLVSQSFKNFEVLVCDDGSTDGTKKIIEKYQSVLELKYFFNENTGGPAGPRNVGIANATGEWICFLDSDDWYIENRLEYLSELDLSNTDIIYHNLNVIREDKVTSITTSRNLSKIEPYYDLLFNLNAVPTTSTCIRANFLLANEGFNTNKAIIGLEDFDLWIRLAKNGARFKYIPVVLGCYAYGDDNLTLHDERQINRFKALYQTFIDDEPNYYKRSKIKAALNYQIGWINTLMGNVKIGFPFLVKSLCYGSIPIKLRSINIMLKGFRKILAK